MENKLLKKDFVFVDDYEYIFMYIVDEDEDSSLILKRALSAYPIKKYVLHDEYVLLFCDLPTKTVDYDLHAIYDYCIDIYTRTKTIELNILPINTIMTEQGFSILPRGTEVITGNTYSPQQFKDLVLDEIDNELGIRDDNLFEKILKKHQKNY